MIDKLIKERHSVTRFSTKKADWRDIIKALDSARLTPLAGNIQVLKFLVVTEEEKIKKIAEACQQDFIKNVSYVVVFCSDHSQLERNFKEKAKVYVRQQTGAAIQNFLLKITELGLATCWIGSFVEDDIRSLLHIPTEVEIEALFPVGYEMPPKGKQKFKKELDTMLYFDLWKNRFMRRARLKRESI